MLLCDGDLHLAIASGDLGIEPFSPGLVQPASVDVRLGQDFLFGEHHTQAFIDPLVPCEAYTKITVTEFYALHPGEFVLASTLEKITMGNAVAGRLEGKSSLGRLGLLVHSTAGFIDPGFTGTITLELSNVARVPIILRPGMLIGQLAVLRLTGPVTHPYGSAEAGSHYQGQAGPTPSRSGPGRWQP